jgi:thymidylate synthase (FAD)
MAFAEDCYLRLINSGAKPEEARCILPLSTKAETIVTYNLREWRHFFKLRCSPKAHPQMREITIPMLAEFKRLIPVIFDDIEVA